MVKDVEKILQGCFHPKEGRPNLHKVPVSAERAGQHIDKAHNNLRAMKSKTARTKICQYSGESARRQGCRAIRDRSAYK